MPSCISNPFSKFSSIFSRLFPQLPSISSCSVQQFSALLHIFSRGIAHRKRTDLFFYDLKDIQKNSPKSTDSLFHIFHLFLLPKPSITWLFSFPVSLKSCQFSMQMSLGFTLVHTPKLSQLCCRFALFLQLFTLLFSYFLVAAYSFFSNTIQVSDVKSANKNENNIDWIFKWREEFLLFVNKSEIRRWFS